MMFLTIFIFLILILFFLMLSLAIMIKGQTEGKTKHKDYIKGGKADKYKNKQFDKRFLKTGTKIEMEHTGSRRIAKEIARDHGVETDKDPGPKVKSDYYHKKKGLPAMEKRLEREAKKSRDKINKKNRELAAKKKKSEQKKK